MSEEEEQRFLNAKAISQLDKEIASGMLTKTEADKVADIVFLAALYNELRSRTK